MSSLLDEPKGFRRLRCSSCFLLLVSVLLLLAAAEPSLAMVVRSSFSRSGSNREIKATRGWSTTVLFPRRQLVVVGRRYYEANTAIAPLLHSSTSSSSSVDEQDHPKQKQEANDDINDTSLVESYIGPSSSGGGFGLISNQQLSSWTEPLQGILDDSSAGWILSYANLAPASTETFSGRAFLATNLAYAVAGLLLTMTGDATLGLLTDVAAVASFNYHWRQLDQSGRDLQFDGTSTAVRMALLVDYVFALLSIAIAGWYLVGTADPVTGMPLAFQEDAWPALACVAVGLGFLGLSWKYEKGEPYMWFHSAWHFFSAYAGYLIGTLHYEHLA